jgi:transcription antitermination protein NusB
VSVGRRKARREALFLLYQQDLMELDPDRAIQRLEQIGEDVDPYTRRLVHGIYDHRVEIDELIGAKLRDWSLSRLAAIERSILRLGVFELRWVEEVPAAVAIDEAVELAKRFASNEGAALVHGVLGAVQGRPEGGGTGGG